MVWVLLMGARVAHAGELEGFVGGQGAVSSWQDDSALVSVARAGYRLDERFGVYAFALAGYGAGHEPAELQPIASPSLAGPDAPSLSGRRVLTGGGVGAQLWLSYGKVHPYLRLGVLVLNETPYDRAADHPLGTAIGTSDETHNRLGGVAALGLDVPLWRVAGAEFFASAEASATRLSDKNGPTAYYAGMLGLGVHVDFAATELGR